MSSRSSASVSKPAASEAKSSSGSGRFLALISLTVTANWASWPASSGHRIVLGEGDRDRALVAGAHAHELLLEPGHEPA